MRERLAPPSRELVVAAHRVLELGAVRFHREACTGRGGDRPSEQHVVREDEVGRQPLAHSRGVQLDESFALLPRQLLQKPRLEPLVAVEDEDGKELADLGPDDLGTAQVVPLRMPLLAEDHHLVPGQAPLPRQGAGIDVGARPA